MAAQQSLLELLEHQAGDGIGLPRRRHGSGPVAAENPFAKRFGECASGCANETTDGAPRRVFWCHACEKVFCWSCLLEHKE